MSETDQTQAPTILTEAVRELIALGAAVASNFPGAFQAHHFRATKAGVSKEDMIQAVNIALRIKATPHQEILDMAQAYLVGGGCGCGSCGCEEGDCAEEGCGSGACGCEG